MPLNRIEEGTQLCKEILKSIEGDRPNLIASLRKISRLAQLLNREGEFSWVETKLKTLSTPFILQMEGDDVTLNLIHKSISKLWVELQFGGITETIFEDYKSLVDSSILRICPDAVEKFISVYDRLKGENPEDWAQAITTCRRILKDFADAIYPSTNKIINGRKLDDEHYINRLWAFASEKICSSVNSELIQSEIDYFGARIDALYSLVCKGTHNKISKEEADRALIRTYLLIGDMIRLGEL